LVPAGNFLAKRFEIFDRFGKAVAKVRRRRPPLTAAAAAFGALRS
jgi:hypothetical protein